MRLKSTSAVSTTTQSARSTLVPTLLIACEAGFGSSHHHGDRQHLPDLTAIKARKASNPATQLQTFAQAVHNALERVWIIDPYLLIPDKGADRDRRIQQVQAWFEHGFAGKDVRILTDATSDIEPHIIKEFRKTQDRINEPRKLQAALEIQVRFTLSKQFPYVHDRFAVIDDELWHFGATVGGLHQDVSAASRGWHVEEHRAIEFFELAWKGDSDRTGRK